jgi:hypothetical protein
MTYDFALTLLAASIEFGGLIAGIMVAIAAVIANTRDKLDLPQERRKAVGNVGISLFIALLIDSLLGTLTVVWLVTNSVDGDFGRVAVLLIIGVTLLMIAMPAVGYLAFKAANR